MNSGLFHHKFPLPADLTSSASRCLEATIEINKMHPDTKVLVMTKNEAREYLSRLLKAGVFGYLLKKAVGSDLTTALKALGLEKLCFLRVDRNGSG